jgi:S1-C subfamily serine protease
LACGTEQPPKRTNAIPQSIIGSGTGFAVSGNGDIVTNHHVVKGCDTIKTTVNNRLISLSLVNVDTQNDIALLNSQSIHLPALPFENSAIYPLQDVIAAGYPLIQQLGTSLKFTKGVISSLSGMGKRHSEFQLDAAIQPGNSGGPVVDTHTGNVLGMAVAKLAVSQKQIEKGFIPEGTNFAIKASVIRSFLEANNVQLEIGDTLSRKRQEVARDLTESVLLLTCWK